MAIILDANIIIRFLVNDDKEKAHVVEQLLRGDNTLILSDVTISEIIWVLSSYYEEEKTDIVEKIIALVHLPSIKCNKKTLLTALVLFKTHNIDWADAYLAAFTEENGLEEIYSYYRNLDKIKKIKRLEP